ncbi:hypothetical protein SCA6_001253 [Theobroma cacao]
MAASPPPLLSMAPDDPQQNDHLLFSRDRHFALHGPVGKEFKADDESTCVANCTVCQTFGSVWNLGLEFGFMEQATRACLLPHQGEDRIRHEVAATEWWR